MRDIIKYGSVLMLFNLIAGALLAFVYIKTAPVIEANKMAAAGENVMAEVLPGVSGGFDQKGEGSDFPYWTGYTDSGKRNIGGYVFITREKGYSSIIESMVGIDIDGTITGVKILFQQETPGLGDKIEEIKAGENDPWFPRQFVGKSASFNFNVNQDGGGIDAISGATVSSRAVAGSIINGINNLLNSTGGEAFSQKIETAEIVPETEQAVEEKEESAFELPDIEMVAVVLPGMDGGYELTEEGDVVYWTGYMDMAKTEPGGYIFVAQGEGFASTIVTAVGVDTDGAVVGIKVLSHEETPGYGDKLDEILEDENEPWFPRQFIGKSASDTIALTEDDGDIDALSGATISSRAFTESIDNGLKQLMEAITGESFAMQEDEEEGESTSTELSEEVMEEVLPGIDGGYELTEEGDVVYWTGYMDMAKTEPGGYIFVAQGEGFASTIVTAVGVDTDGTIVGIKVLSHEETPDYGDKLDEILEGENEPWFPRQFIGKSVSNTIALTEDNGDIDALSEATISSRAVTESIESGLKQLMEAVEDF